MDMNTTTSTTMPLPSRHKPNRANRSHSSRKRNQEQSFCDASSAVLASESERICNEPGTLDTYNFSDTVRVKNPRTRSDSKLTKAPCSENDSEELDDSRMRQEKTEFIQETKTKSHKSTNCSPNNWLESNKPETLEKPRRALSAYNFFLREERQRILASKESIESCPGVPPKKRRVDSNEFDNSPQTSGYIGFMEIGKLIGKRWQEVKSKPELRARYEELSKNDHKRYKEELEAYNEKKKEVLLRVLEKPNSSSKTTKEDDHSPDRNSTGHISDSSDKNSGHVPMKSVLNGEKDEPQNTERLLHLLKDLSDKQKLRNSLCLGINNQIDINQPSSLPGSSLQSVHLHSTNQAAAQNNDAAKNLISSLLSQQMAPVPTARADLNPPTASNDHSMLLGGRQAYAQGMAQQLPDLNKLLMDYLQAEQMERTLSQGMQQVTQGQHFVPNIHASVLNNQNSLPVTSQLSLGNMLAGGSPAAALLPVFTNPFNHQFVLPNGSQHLGGFTFPSSMESLPQHPQMQRNMVMFRDEPARERQLHLNNHGAFSQEQLLAYLSHLQRMK